MPTRTMTVNGIQIQSSTKYNLLSGATTGFRKITVTKDDGTPPPALGKASGSIDSSQADVLASTAVWNEMNQALLRFPFSAKLTFDANNNVTDLEFFQINTALARNKKVAALRAVRALLEKLVGDVEWVVGPQILPAAPEEYTKKRARNGQGRAAPRADN